MLFFDKIKKTYLSQFFVLKVINLNLVLLNFKSIVNVHVKINVQYKLNFIDDGQQFNELSKC